MSTTGIVLSLTDEQLKDIDEYCEMTQHIESGEQACVSLYELRGLLEELSRLRAENAELAQSLAESRENDQAAMGWLTSLRWASGDRGERMLPELVTHIEGLAKDAGRYRWLQKASPYMHKKIRDLAITDGGDVFYFHKDKYDASIDTAMAAQ